MIKKIISMGLALIMCLSIFGGCSDWVDDYEWSDDSFSLEVVVDNIEVLVGEEVTVTATFRNLSGRNLYVYIDQRLDPNVLWPQRRRGRQNRGDAEFGSYNILLSHSSSASTLFEIPENSIWGNPYLLQRMDYYNRYRLVKDAVIVRTKTFMFIDNSYLDYCTCGEKSASGKCPFLTQLSSIPTTAIPKRLNYGTASVAFFTSRRMAPETRFLINKCIQFNIIE